MHTRRFFLGLLAAGLLIAQEPAATLKVTGAVKKPLTLTAEDLAKMPRKSVRTVSKDVETKYDGVALHEILKAAGVPVGADLRGKALTTYVLAEAQDGYQIVFSIGEIDPAFNESDILVADTANGKPLAGNQGSFRLVPPKDKQGNRSVRMLTRLEVVQVAR
jgi:DMSO/TMAO reductase YedYZ molybdopterin-dependent catalytic subunit